MKKFKRTILKITETGISWFKYALAVFMIIEGFLTMCAPTESVHGALGFIYSSRISLVILGFIFVVSGSILLYAKIRRSRKWTGRGLLAVYLCFLFATIIQAVAYSGVLSAWVGNLLFTMIVGGLYLRWKYKTEYINPNYFYERTWHLRKDTPDRPDLD